MEQVDIHKVLTRMFAIRVMLFKDEILLLFVIYDVQVLNFFCVCD